MLEISVTEYKRVDLIEISGRIDSSNASELDDVFNSLADNGRYQLVVEGSGVKFMASAGVRALTAAYQKSKKHRGDLRFVTPSKRLVEVIRLAGLEPLFSPYFDDITAAVGSY